jgi:GNAT superfamily N-acetyltransferase
MTYEIRPARGSDASAIARILKEIGWFQHANETPETALAGLIQDKIAHAGTGHSQAIFIAVDAAQACLGYVSVHWVPYLIFKGPEGYVSELFVSAQHRGRGIGTRLLDAAIAEARNRGCVRLGLLSNRERESYERGFYTSRGWIERPEMANMVYFLDENK